METRSSGSTVRPYTFVCRVARCCFRLWAGLIKFDVVLLLFAASDIVWFCCYCFSLNFYCLFLFFAPGNNNSFHRVSFSLIQRSSSFVGSFVYKLKTITVSCNTKYCATKHTHTLIHTRFSGGRFVRFVPLCFISSIFPFYRVSMPLYFLSFFLFFFGVRSMFACDYTLRWHDYYFID